jgi:hypothetical protein
LEESLPAGVSNEHIVSSKKTKPSQFLAEQKSEDVIMAYIVATAAAVVQS